MSSTKIAISLPEELFEEVERLRERRGLSRSAVVQHSLLAWIRVQGESDKVRRYVNAYRRRPETDEEVREAERMVQILWAAEDER